MPRLWPWEENLPKKYGQWAGKSPEPYKARTIGRTCHNGNRSSESRIALRGLRVVYFCSFSVVTGCTEGIGEEFARQLGGRGCNVALVARNEDKMRRIAQEIGKV